MLIRKKGLGNLALCLMLSLILGLSGLVMPAAAYAVDEIPIAALSEIEDVLDYQLLADPVINADINESMGQPVDTSLSDEGDGSLASDDVVGGKDPEVEDNTVSSYDIAPEPKTVSGAGDSEELVETTGDSDASGALEAEPQTGASDVSITTNNGFEEDAELISTNSHDLIMPAAAGYEVKIIGDGVENPITLTKDDLEQMEQVFSTYSSINTWPTKKWYTAEGVKLADLLDMAVIKPEAKLITVKSTDGYKMTFTRKELLTDHRYYYPGLKENAPYDGSIPGSPDSAVKVDTILALQSIDSENPEYMSDQVAPLLVFGQRWVTEQTNHAFAKYVGTIEVSTATPEKWANPTATPASGTVAAGTGVKLSSPNNDADKVHYTTDGSNPTYKSPMYNWIASRWWSSREDVLDEINHPIEINEDTTIKAVVIGIGKDDSDIVSLDYKVAAPEPIVFTVGGNAVEASYTMADLKAMPATINIYGNKSCKGVALPDLLEALNINDNTWTVKVIMKDSPNGVTLPAFDESASDYLLTYEIDGEAIVVDGSNLTPLRMYFDVNNSKMNYKHVTGLTVTKPESANPPVLVAATTDNTVGNSIVITFADDETWRTAVTEVKVNGTILASDKYTVAEGKLTFDASIFEAAGDYTITVKATAYQDATVTQTMVESAESNIPPTLTASTSGNTVGNPIRIFFTDDPEWRNAITEVSIDGTKLDAEQYKVTTGKISIIAGLFTEVKVFNITVKANGYKDASVMQEIEARPMCFVTEGKGNMVYVSGRNNHTVAIKNDGTVWAWGDGQGGMLGDGEKESRTVPDQVYGLTEVKMVATGDNHTLALKNDGTVWAWGYNLSGRLGDGTKINSSVPVQVITDSATGTALTDVQMIAAGDGYSVALKNDGTVWTWGNNGYGKLGDGTTQTSILPVQVTDLTNVKTIATGKEHSVALKNDGTVWTWGRNNFGQLGNGLSGSSERSTIPVQVMIDPETNTPLTDVKAIAAGMRLSFAIKNDGTVWGWGASYDGKLGPAGPDGWNAHSCVPIQVIGLTDTKMVAAGENHGISMKNDGTVWVWGYNNYGGFGIEGLQSSSMPVQLCEPADLTMINAGYFHSFAIKKDGTIWSWGQNTKGKLGDGTTEDRAVPTQVRLAPQSITQAVTESNLGENVELVFTDDAAWRESITGVSVDGVNLASDKYSVTTGKIILDGSNFNEAREYSITVKAAGFLDAAVTQQVSEAAEPITYTVTFAVTPEDATVVVKDSEGIEVAAEADGTYKLEAGEYSYTVSAEGYVEQTGNFTVTGEAQTVTVVLEEETVQPETPQYKITPEPDAIYEIGVTEDGIKTMTVNADQIGFKYFTVSIEPVIANEGTETVVFTHRRNDTQLELNAVVADFDVADTAKAGFNVQTGDVIRAYIVDRLTNETACNPIVFNY
ncbi:RCC1 domain-containing protein [Syntrophomonas erecta]